ncbi:MAG: FAD:protein FMN transferase [Sedimentisphaerales bacterium]|nr:FAD:protein FMN transferase [Sedimentisphaerales bacterium]
MTQSQPDISFIANCRDSIPDAHRFSHNAMVTVFEVIIIHKDARYARQAAWAAFDELDRLEQQLSRFVENSDISRINNLTANQPLLVGPAAFECLQLCASLYDQTSGAFDITIGSLMDCWLSEDKTMRTPSEEQLKQARQHTGLHLIKLDETEHTVRILTSRVQIDLGGIGKGYAVDQMAKLLNDWSIDAALIHGGCSSVLALGSPHNTKGWHLTLSNPANRKQTLAHLYLQDRAISGSGLQKGPHIIDPRKAQPVRGKRAAWACAPTAAAADALSTAFMVMSPDQIRKYCLSHPDTLAMVVAEERDGKDKILRYGLWEQNVLLKK